jgi:uncharacterized protein YndB with AHSA1/START domain
MKETVVRLTRSFAVPREAVFAAWTEARHLSHWFGPRGFSIHSCETDPRPGGSFRLCMRSPGGQDYWVRGVFRELQPPERLVIACTAEDEKGVPRLEEVIDVTFAEQGGRTELRLQATARGASPEAQRMLEGMHTGWAQTVARLDAHLKPD